MLKQSVLLIIIVNNHFYTSWAVRDCNDNLIFYLLTPFNKGYFNLYMDKILYL